MGATRDLADFIARTQYEDLTEESVRYAKFCLMDWLGVTLGGCREPLSDIIMETIDALGGNEQATIIGRGTKTSLLNAALLNGSASHALDFDDVQHQMMGHPSVPVIPALLAVAEWRRSGGRDFITALVLGVEAECRIGMAVNPAHYEEFWHATATLGTFGAAAAVAKLLGLDSDRIVHALGIAGTQAGGLKQVFGTMSKPFHAGKAAMNGLLAALLAQNGFTCSQDILEGEKGFCQVLASKSEPGKIAENLGQSYLIESVQFKQHASCFGTHPTIDAALAIREEHGPRIEDIEAVRVVVPPLVIEIAGQQEPKTGLEGKFSLYYCAALALAEGKTGERYFLDEMVQNPRLVELRKKVTVISNTELDPDLGSPSAAVTVRMADGKEYEARPSAVGLGAGEPEKKAAGLTSKFKDVTTPFLRTDQADAVIGFIENLEQAADVAQLMMLCNGGAP